ncbi:MAG TPA: DNA polymerase III subunit beta [Pseudomonadota bacterium]|jgi:DNA polymerase-3 subunit beta|nr:DNA polymerase III subunit beta [Pseudomonadota bacterium]
MDFHIEKAAFLQALYYAQGIADRKSTMPILANVLLRSEGTDRITVAATDLNLTVTTELPCSVNREGGLTASAKHLHDLVKTLPSEKLHLRRADNNYAEIASGKASYKVVGLPDRDFPKLPSHKEVKFHKVDVAALRDMISKTMFSISTDETRSHLNGVLFECEGHDDLAFGRMVSTDGHRLSKCERPLPGAPRLKPGVVIPRRGIMEVRRAIESSNGSVEIAAQNQYFFLRTGATVLSVRLTEANFPPYSQVIPKDHQKQATVSTSQLLEALKRISLVASEKTWGVKLSLSNGAMRIESDNPDLGQGKEELDVTYQGEETVIGFNAKYMIELLSEMDTPEVQIELNGDLDPGLLRPLDPKQGVGNQYLGVIMPMRL